MNPARVLIAALIPMATLTVAEEKIAPDPDFAWLVDFLEANSAITIVATEETPREVISTRTQGRIVYGDLIVEYERFTYQSDMPDMLERHQKIFYSADLAAIDPDTIAVQNAGESAPGVSFWMVSFDARPDPGFFAYHNIVQHYGETNTPQVFTSKGKIRTIILGYLTDEKKANELAEKFRTSLKAAIEASPDATRPTQSAA
jgi:hypothetical protein